MPPRGGRDREPIDIESAASPGPAARCRDATIAVPCGPPSSWDSWPPSDARAARLQQTPPRPASVLLVTVDTLRADRARQLRRRGGAHAGHGRARGGRRAVRARLHAGPDHAARAHVDPDRPPAARARRARQRRVRARSGDTDPRGGVARARPGHGRLHRRLPAGPALRARARVRHLRRRDGEVAGRELRVRGAARGRRGGGGADLAGRPPGPRVRVGAPLRSPRPLRSAARLPRVGSLPRRSRGRGRRRRGADRGLGRAARAFDRGPHRRSRRGLRRARRREPQPVRLRRHPPRAAPRARSGLDGGRPGLHRRGPHRHRGHHRGGRRTGRAGSSRPLAATLRGGRARGSRSTRRRWPRASTSAGAISAPGATGDTSTSARRGRSSTTSPPIRPNPATSPPRIPTSWLG